MFLLGAFDDETVLVHVMIGVPKQQTITSTNAENIHNVFGVSKCCKQQLPVCC